jgi:deoxyhypusine synthase
MSDKIKIDSVKQRVEGKTRQLRAEWTVELMQSLHIAKTKPVKDMTEEEKQDEVVRRLATHPVKQEEYTQFDQQMADLIQEEIDKELIKELINNEERYRK